MRRLTLSILIGLLSNPVLAEYRAYQYIVKTNDPYAVATRAPAQYVVSTLNPQVFSSYHGGKSVSIEILRTWVCPGYTGRRTKTCENPYDKGTTTQ